MPSLISSSFDCFGSGEQSPVMDKLRRYSQLIAKEREVREKLEKARQMMVKREQGSPDLFHKRERLLHNALSLDQSVDFRRRCERSMSLSEQLRSFSPSSFTLIDKKPITRTYSLTRLPQQNIHQGHTGQCSSLSIERSTRPACPGETSSPTTASRVGSPRLILRDDIKSSSEHTKSRERIVEAKERANSRLQRIKSLDEDCQKAQELIHRVRSVSCTKMGRSFSEECTVSSNSEGSHLDYSSDNNDSVFSSPGCIV